MTEETFEPTEPTVDVEVVSEKAFPLGRLPIKAVNDLDPWGICIALYGAPGSGKTTLAAQLGYTKKDSPVLFLDVEGGIRSVTHIPNVFVIPIEKWSEFNEATSLIMREGKRLPYKTIVIDNMSELQAVHMRSINAGIPEIRDWNINSTQMMTTTRMYRNFARTTGINVIFVAWSSLDKATEEGMPSRNRLSFTPSLAEKFPGIVDIVGYLTVESGGIRQLSFSPSYRTDAKFRRSRNENAMKIPLVLKYPETTYPLVDIVTTLKEGTPWPESKYVRQQAQNQNRPQNQQNQGAGNNGAS